MRIINIFIFAILVGSLNAQTSVNPDISVIGQLLGSYAADEIELHGSSVELAFQGYVNPFARVDVYLHKHMDSEPIGVEEAVLSIERGLPLGLALRTGKLRPDFGKINSLHMHMFPQILLPEPVAQMLGEEKWGSSGIETRWLMPLLWYSNLSLAYLQEGISTHHHVAVEEEESSPGPAISGRYSIFFDLGNFSHIETGISTYQLVDDADQKVSGFDLKYKWRPDKYRSLIWESELFYKTAFSELDEGVLEKHSEVLAGYTLVTYQFKKVWNAGTIFDYSSDLEDLKYTSSGIFMGFSPAEESTVFRLFIKGIQHGTEKPQFLIQTQLLWSLGPHKAHKF
ncbi:MAG: hypothetical protein K9N35_08990 [Candidatus Marinimicrobia bacterium]|nr:hypothetical protein [Candidatus Neomarinimicrobiota bacterium]